MVMRLLCSLLASTIVGIAASLPEFVPEVDTRATKCSTAGSDCVAAAKAAFTSAKIVPNLIPSFNPDTIIEANYNGKQVNFGTTFNINETKPQPNITFSAEPNHDPSTTKYSVFIVDPDAPGPGNPVLADVLHFLYDNAQPSCITNQSPNILAAYMSPSPLSVAPHRYTFLVYRQPPNYVAPADPQYSLADRISFNLTAYVAKAGLEGPVAGNFFREGLTSAECAATPNCTETGVGFPTS
ncbi:MAG: hypothetical protein M1822_004222 [Bathelium mastoideum]|nr:MAG: hypothetical protein M1822_004222 [Bathelium mastoideum]